MTTRGKLDVTKEYNMGYAHGYRAGVQHCVEYIQCLAAGIKPPMKFNYDGGSPGPAPLTVPAYAGDPESGRGQPSPETIVGETIREEPK